MSSEATIDPYIAEQIAARERPSVIKTKLLTLRSHFPEGLIVAIEGDDDKIVYSHWILRTCPDAKYEFIVCGGKRQVKSLCNSVARDAGDLGSDVIFLVDRDFDELDGFERVDAVFMLDRYSVENYLVDTETISLILPIAYPCHGRPDIRDGICAVYADDHTNFLLAMADMNRRIYVARRLGFNIDGIIPKSLVDLASIQLSCVTKREYDAAALIPFPSEPAVEDLKTLHQEFISIDPSLRFRGKFSIKFLYKWFEHLLAEFKSGTIGLFSPLGSQPGNAIPAEISLGGLASRSPMPSGFAAFMGEVTHREPAPSELAEAF